MGSQSDELSVDMKCSDSKVTPIDEGEVEASDNDLYIDPAKQVKLLAKLDLFLTPVIMLVYLCCFLDRSNIGMPLSRFVCSFLTQGRQRQGCWHARGHWGN
jgi:hypothetical protein